LWTIIILMAYLTDVYELLPGLWNDFKNMVMFNFSAIEYSTSWVFISSLTFTTYMAAGIAREQVCIYMCPYPRIQAALIDEEALNVTYRYDRGEPRVSLKQKKKMEAAGEHMGDCIECDQCVWACPTGTDIRLGNQLSCVNCGLCIDACNVIMKKVGLPTGLIAFDTDLNIERRQKGENNKFKTVRPRTILYTVAIAISIGLIGWGLTHRTVTGINVLHDRNPLYVQEGDGSIMNAYTVRMLNMERKTRRFNLSVSGLEGLKISKITEGMYSFKKSDKGGFIVTVEPDTTRELRIIVVLPSSSKISTSETMVFTAKDIDTGESLTRSDFFKGPGE
jgi:cytochrome c oxidase accessory protein FixG